MNKFSVKTNSPEESKVILEDLIAKGYENPENLTGECVGGYYNVDLFNIISCTYLSKNAENHYTVYTLKNIPLIV